ncbi:hypothetical protein [Pseudomonas sp. DP-17]|uniref:alpha-glutamyl/putrescinyl thymine pyrophosphorylase clade 3 protein n=1 Tax=Pseudomonas sp. DP-17 TaxID=1580486 RepID=UPI001EFBDCB8|nr:hypothetical protein [Pseudomonas sp. DP-17]MCG8911429.1 hypothetical protein [Pseudomonas sp. DP-17]
MRERDRELAQNLEDQLIFFSNEVRALPGIDIPENRDSLIAQLVDSIRRIRFVETIRRRRLSPLRGDANSTIFDPIKAAVIHVQNGNIEEASWLTFLAIHFGKSSQDGWALTQAFYSALDQGFTWNWNRASYNPDAVLEWLEQNYQELSNKNFHFGNHRKYESINPSKRSFTGLVLRSYILWITDNISHEELFRRAIDSNDGNPRRAFRSLYKSMNAVYRFGRIGKFDYLTMIGKIGATPIEADSTYMVGATGPYDGAVLLFTGQAAIDIPRRTLDNWIIELDEHVNVGMQVLEDALCNWQKSPSTYKQFRG